MYMDACVYVAMYIHSISGINSSKVTYIWYIRCSIIWVFVVMRVRVRLSFECEIRNSSYLWCIYI